MKEFTGELDGFKFMLGGFEEMALDIIAECHDPDRDTMLANVRQVFAGLKEQVGPLTTEADLAAMYAVRKDDQCEDRGRNEYAESITRSFR